MRAYYCIDLKGRCYEHRIQWHSIPWLCCCNYTNGNTERFGSCTHCLKLWLLCMLHWSACLRKHAFMLYLVLGYGYHGGTLEFGAKSMFPLQLLASRCTVLCLGGALVRGTTASLGLGLGWSVVGTFKPHSSIWLEVGGSFIAYGGRIVWVEFCG